MQTIAYQTTNTHQIVNIILIAKHNKAFIIGRSRFDLGFRWDSYFIIIAPTLVWHHNNNWCKNPTYN